LIIFSAGTPKKMYAVDLRRTFDVISSTMRDLPQSLAQEVLDIDWEAANIFYNRAKLSLGAAADDPSVFLKQHKQFEFHLELRSILKVFSEETSTPSFDEVLFLFEKLEACEMAKPKWIANYDANIVRAFCFINNAFEGGETRCRVCTNVSLDVTNEDFEENVLKLCAVADFKSHKNRTKCRACDENGESVMDSHAPSIQICGHCGLPLIQLSQPNEADEIGNQIISEQLSSAARGGA